MIKVFTCDFPHLNKKFTEFQTLSVLFNTFKLIHAYGNPVGVSNAGRKRFPKSSARTSN